MATELTWWMSDEKKERKRNIKRTELSNRWNNSVFLIYIERLARNIQMKSALGGYEERRADEQLIHYLLLNLCVCAVRGFLLMCGKRRLNYDQHFMKRNLFRGRPFDLFSFSCLMVVWFLLRKKRRPPYSTRQKDDDLPVSPRGPCPAVPGTIISK